MWRIAVNRSRTFSYECEIPARNKYQTKIVSGGEKSPVFTPNKAICILRRTTPQRLLPSLPAGMKNYREDDYFCRQTYELLILEVSIGMQRFVLLLPAISNGTCHAKPAAPRNSLNLRSCGASAG